MKIVDRDYDAPGGSTLATQIEKYRHSPSGITSSVFDKLRQMYSATLRAYSNGPDTTGGAPAHRARVPEHRAVRGGAPSTAKSPGSATACGRGSAPTSTRSTRSCRSPPAERPRCSRNRRKAYPPGAEPADRAAAPDVVPRTRAASSSPGSPTATCGSLAAADIISPELRDAALDAKLAFRDDGGGGAARLRALVERRDRRCATASPRCSRRPRLYDVDRLDVKVGEHARRRDAGRGHRHAEAPAGPHVT